MRSVLMGLLAVIVFVGLIAVVSRRTTSESTSPDGAVNGANRVDSRNDRARALFAPAGAAGRKPQRSTEAAAPDWQKRLQQLLRAPEQMEPNEIEDLARDLPPEEISAVLELVFHPESTNSSSVETLGRLLLNRWAEDAPARAAQWIERLPQNAFSLEAHRTVATAFASQDLNAAMTWLENLPDTGNKTAAKLVVGYEAAQKRETSTAISLLSELPANPERDHLLKYSALQWATTDRDGAVAWAGAVSDSALREEMLGRIATDWSVQDPAQAAAFAATAMPPGERQDKAVLQIVQGWAVTAPTQVAAWVTQFPAVDLQNDALGRLTAVWAQTDLVTPGHWLNQLPAGTSRDVAVGEYATVLARSHPDLAVAWLQIIQDETLRARVQARLRPRGQ